MRWKILAFGLLGVVAVGLSSGKATAADRDFGAKVQTLGGSAEDADTIPVWGRYRRGWCGGWGGWGGYGWGGGYRSFAYSYYPSYSFGYNSFCRPSFYYNSYSYIRPYYYAPPVYSYNPYSVYWFPTSGGGVGTTFDVYSNLLGDLAAKVPAKSLEMPRAVPGNGLRPTPQPGNGTFQYNGGPSNPVPMPREESQPNNVLPPPTPVPLDGLSVSLRDIMPKKYSYQAYGADRMRLPPAKDRVYLTGK